MKNTKVEILIKDQLYITGLDKKVKKIIKGALTFVNPKYEQAENHGLYMPSDLEPQLKYFKTKDKQFIIPKGTSVFVERMIKKYSDQKYKIINETVCPKIETPFKFKGKLRSYQKTAFKKMTVNDFGVLQAGTGSGKTVMALKIIAKRQTKTLILVHNKELLYQWQDRINEFLGIECGLIGDGHDIVKDVTVGIINSVKNRVTKLKKIFGFVVLDECHRCPASSWTEALSKFYAKYQLGLSATPYRKDGLGNAIYAFVGLLEHEVKTKMLQKTGAILKPEIRLIKTRFWFQYRNNYSTMINSLTSNAERNKLIVNEVVKDFKKRKSPILIVSDRVSHCKLLQEELNNLNIKTVLLHSGVAKNKRKDIVQQVRDGKADVLISTLSLIGEGFDAPNLYSLFLTTPVKFSGRLIQIVGRLLRPEKGKIAIVFDFRDDGCPVLRASGRKRNETYESQGW